MCRKSRLMLEQIRPLNMGELQDGLTQVIASTLRISSRAAAHHAQRTFTKVDQLRSEHSHGLFDAFHEALEDLVREFDRRPVFARATTSLQPRQLFIGPDGVVIGAGRGVRDQLRHAGIHHAQACDARSH